MFSCLLIHKSILKQAALTPLLKPEIPVIEFSNKASMDYSTAEEVFAHIPPYFPISSACSRWRLFPVIAGSLREMHWLH